jgi:hypothetical protein
MSKTNQRSKLKTYPGIPKHNCKMIKATQSKKSTIEVDITSCSFEIPRL